MKGLTESVGKAMDHDDMAGASHLMSGFFDKEALSPVDASGTGVVLVSPVAQAVPSSAPGSALGVEAGLAETRSPLLQPAVGTVPPRPRSRRVVRLAASAGGDDGWDNTAIGAAVGAAAGSPGGAVGVVIGGAAGGAAGAVADLKEGISDNEKRYQEGTQKWKETHEDHIRKQKGKK